MTTTLFFWVALYLGIASVVCGAVLTLDESIADRTGMLWFVTFLWPLATLLLVGSAIGWLIGRLGAWARETL